MAAPPAEFMREAFMSVDKPGGFHGPNFFLVTSRQVRLTSSIIEAQRSESTRPLELQ
jgi:hypothetical protein